MQKSNVSPDQFEAISLHADAFMAFSRLAIATTERLTTLNLNAVRTALQTSAIATNEMLESNGSTAPANINKSNSVAATQHAIAYVQNMQDLARDTQQELSHLITSYFDSQGHAASHGKAWLKGLPTYKDVASQFSAITESHRKAMTGMHSRGAAAEGHHPANQA